MQPTDQRRNDKTADEERADEEAERFGRDHRDHSRAQGLVFRHAADDREDDQAENVVDHRGAEHDLAFGVVQPAQVIQHPPGDADAGGRQRRPGQDTFFLVLTEPVADHVSAGKRKHHAHDSHHRRGAARAEQLHEVGFQTDFKQQDDYAHLGEEAKYERAGQLRVVRADQAQHRRPEDDARQEFAQHGRLADRPGAHAEKPGDDQDDGQHAKELCDEMMVHFSAVGGFFVWRKPAKSGYLWHE